jgi:hypothetical protein
LDLRRTSAQAAICGSSVQRVLHAARQEAQLLQVRCLRSGGDAADARQHQVSWNSAASWVVKALVEATPISAPARV